MAPIDVHLKAREKKSDVIVNIHREIVSLKKANSVLEQSWKSEQGDTKGPN